MLEFKEAPENMLLCPAEVRHPGATGRPAEHRDKGHHKQFAKVVTRIVSPGIGDLVEGRKKDVHAGNGLQKGVSRPRIHPPQNRKIPQIKSDPKRDSPEAGAGSSLAWSFGAVLKCDRPPSSPWA